MAIRQCVQYATCRMAIIYSRIYYILYYYIVFFIPFPNSLMSFMRKGERITPCSTYCRASLFLSYRLRPRREEHMTKGRLGNKGGLETCQAL